jgi:hypothetical protein
MVYLFHIHLPSFTIEFTEHMMRQQTVGELQTGTSVQPLVLQITIYYMVYLFHIHLPSFTIEFTEHVMRQQTVGESQTGTSVRPLVFNWHFLY